MKVIYMILVTETKSRGDGGQLLQFFIRIFSGLMYKLKSIDIYAFI